MFNGLANLNLQTVNLQNLNVATSNLNNGQVTSLVQALNSNPQAQQNATQLTQQLQQQGKIGPNQQVIGVNGNQVFVADRSLVSRLGMGQTGGTAGGTANPSAGNAVNLANLPPQASAMLNGLNTVNFQNLNVRSVANVTDVVNRGQVSAMLKALNSNPQLQQIAQQLTSRLRADGRIGANQRVIGFMDGQVIITQQ